MTKKLIGLLEWMTLETEGCTRKWVISQPEATKWESIKADGGGKTDAEGTLQGILVIASSPRRYRVELQ